MRDKHYNEIDNLVERTNKSQTEKINNILKLNYNKHDRSPEKFRQGLLSFGAFQMENTDTSYYAMFGVSSGSTMVGP